MLVTDSAEEFKVDHSHLVSKYHEAMIVGLSLIAENLEQWVTAKEPVCTNHFLYLFLAFSCFEHH
jgi:hypothetical protein